MDIILFALTCLSMLAMSNAQIGFGMGGGEQELSPEQQKCFQSFHDNNMGDCLQSLHTGFQSQELSISPECCSYISTIHSACASLVHHENPYYEEMVKQHCSGGSASPAMTGRKTTPGSMSKPKMPGAAGAMPKPKMPGAAGAMPKPKMPGAAGAIPKPKMPGAAGAMSKPKMPGAAGATSGPKMPGGASAATSGPKTPTKPGASAATSGPKPKPVAGKLGGGLGLPGADDEPAKGPDDEPDKGPDDVPATGPDDEPATDPDDEPAADPDDEPAADPDDEPATDPDDEPEMGDR